jgi:DNA-binding transcriptional LysR family regulator
MRGLTLKQLRSLQAVVETGSMTEAGTRQSLSPPAIHSQIRKLEEAVDAHLVDKDAETQGFVATPSGKVLIAAAERIEGILSWAHDNLAALEQGSVGHVRIGFESTGRYFAPRLIALLRQRCPSIAVSFEVANRNRIIECLAKEKIDLAVIGRPPRQPLTEATPIGEHPYTLFVPPQHALARKPDYDPETLIEQPILAREPGSGTRILLDRFLSQIEGYGTPTLIELDSNETIKEAIMAELGVGMLSMHVAKRELADGRLVMLNWPRLPIMRYWYLVLPLTARVSESTQRIRQIILDENGAFLRDEPHRFP